MQVIDCALVSEKGGIRVNFHGRDSHAKYSGQRSYGTSTLARGHANRKGREPRQRSGPALSLARQCTRREYPIAKLESTFCFAVGWAVLMKSSQVAANLWARANICGMPMSDTSPEAPAKQLEIVRAMSGEERMTLAYEMSMFVRELMREGIRSDHPHWTDAQIQRELLRRAFFPKPLPAGLP